MLDQRRHQSINVLLFCATILLAACDVESGVVETAPNTFTVEDRASPVMGGMRKAHDEAMVEATGYCQHVRGQFSLLSTVPLSAAGPGEPEGMTVNFLCTTPAGPSDTVPSSNIAPGTFPAYVPSGSFRGSGGLYGGPG